VSGASGARLEGPSGSEGLSGAPLGAPLEGPSPTVLPGVLAAPISEPSTSGDPDSSAPATEAVSSASGDSPEGPAVKGPAVKGPEVTDRIDGAAATDASGAPPATTALSGASGDRLEGPPTTAALSGVGDRLEAPPATPELSGTDRLEGPPVTSGDRLEGPPATTELSGDHPERTPLTTKLSGDRLEGPPATTEPSGDHPDGTPPTELSGDRPERPTAGDRSASGADHLEGPSGGRPEGLPADGTKDRPPPPDAAVENPADLVTAGDRLVGDATGDVATTNEDDERRSGGDRRRAGTIRAPGAEAEPVYMDPEAATLPAPEHAASPPQHRSSLDPAAAAFEAARIAGEIVGDIESASGAAIVAAAAAGAAIEAARARRASGAPPIVADGEAATMGADPSAGAAPPDGSPADPVTTVRMQRERILRALAEDIAASPAVIEAGKQDPTGRAPSQPGQQSARASSQGGASGEEEELSAEYAADPVQVAAAAIQRLRHRASTDFAELRGHYQRHDLVVLVAAFLIILVAGRVHTGMVTPPTVVFPSQDDAKAQRGLVFEHSRAWLKAEDIPTPPPRIVRDPTGQPPKANDAYHVALTSSLDPNARIEILIDKQPAWTNIVTGLELDRRTRWGELYTLDASSVEEIGDQNWLRTAYRYAHAPDKGDVPRVDRAVEYATVDREQIYVVTLFGSQAELDRIESVVAPTLRIDRELRPGTRSALPLVPQTRSSAHRSYPNPVARAFDSTVMIVVADLVDGRLQARGGGSGVIVGADGSILTNYHVIHDKNGRLHDVFVIGRFSALDRAPQLQCAGRPNRSKLQRELDLALLKCDTDLDGRTWTPSSAGVWATLAEAKVSDVRIGQRLWVLGYPDAGGGGLTLSEGEIDGWTGQDGAAGRDFIKTDASITHGNSGGPVVDDQGKLVGIASASRTKISASGSVIETKQVGLVRPMGPAADLLAIASIGWTPREGHTDVEIQPSAVEASPEGIRIATQILDAANEAPVRDALVMVLRPGVNANAIDVNRLDDQVIAWGRSNTQGEVQLKQPVPIGTYTVLVRASGYEPLIGEDKLRLDDKTPPAFDPWGGIKLLAR
jgi:S1-C subfamily serine protease